MFSFLACSLAVVLAQTPPPTLADAVLYGRAASVRTLIADGADVNAPDDAGMTPLMVAASQGETGIAKMLLAAGAKIGATSEDGTTALMRAASSNRTETMRLLVASGADVNAKTSGGVTALMMAAFGGYAEPARVLLANHADVNAKDNQGRTALMAASNNGDAAVVQALIAGGADVAATDAGGGVALTYAAAAGADAVIDALLKRGIKPAHRELMLAAAACHASAVRLLLAGGLKANDVVDGKSPLLAATGENCVDTVALLLDKGADVNVKDTDGRTPLITAASAGMPEVVRVLLARGADMDVADNLDRTASMYAAMAKNEAIAALFKEARESKSQAAPQPIVVESPTVQPGKAIPRDYTADGRNMSPPITWRNIPAGAKELALVLEDPDAGNPPPFVHWVIYKIPVSATGLPEGISIDPSAAMPAEIAGAIQGVSGFRRPIYRGPAPPPGKPHHYHFVVYALDANLDLKPGLNRAELLAAIQGHIVGRGELVAIYERVPGM